MTLLICSLENYLPKKYLGKKAFPWNYYLPRTCNIYWDSSACEDKPGKDCSAGCLSKGAQVIGYEIQI